ncbi:FYVE zinc finger [Kalmanozyma brasiliensis GHG001]|uniref:FYVE zinc finger n=1 Tax=Kalmanozyma brasiliensis (strain GHG001) TaxID=1365824 RepID=UPI001CE97196|nr:FYVE zinc finger [Kalmanozyma brasiliensis GHG001]EST04724.2 FYVE zinc finger [Kalmanozyma brasiliensis GHG001]
MPAPDLPSGSHYGDADELAHDVWAHAGSSSSSNRRSMTDANGGVGASMHAPPNRRTDPSSRESSYDASGFPSMGLSTRLNRTSSSFGSRAPTNGTEARKPKFAPYEAENLWVTSSSSSSHTFKPPHNALSASASVLTPSRYQQQHSDPLAAANDFQDPLTSAYSSSPNRAASVDQMIHQSQEAEASHVVDSMYPDAQQGDETIRQASRIGGADSHRGAADTSDTNAEEQDDQDDEATFVYPGIAELESGSVTEQTAPDSRKGQDPTDAWPETRQLPEDSADEDRSASHDTAVARSRPQASNHNDIDYNILAALCSRGSVSDLQRFFEEACSSLSEGQGVSSFALANDPNPSNGLVPLHYAAKEGKTDTVRWLITQAGAIVEMEDREGETPLHKAAMAGKLSVASLLLSHGADANAKDSDGWTALHNACSRGYLDLVRLLIDRGGAQIDIQGGRGAWTPLMNAASKGHLPIVRHLTAKYHADPFVRNAAGETAFDVAAASFEVYICEVLERYEAERWNAAKSNPPSHTQPGQIVPGRGHYEPLALHITVPIILHENQRLDTRLQTLAMHGAKPRWSSSSAARAHKPDRRSPSSMPPGPLAPSRTRHAPVRQEDVGLPARSVPYKLRIRTRVNPAVARRRAAAAVAAQRANQPHHGLEDDMASTPTPESVLQARRGGRSTNGARSGDAEEEASHFWLSEWQLDTTHPLVDVEQGWQYAQSFDALDDKWSSQPPPPLERLLEGRGLSASVTRALTGGAGLANAQAEQEASSGGWVRRRRWIRVMRRRLDIEFGDDLEACEGVGSGGSDVGTGHGTDPNGADGHSLSTAAIMAAQEAAKLECSQLGPDADYVSRAKALAGSSAASGATPADALGDDRDELARRIARLYMAITELRAAFEDDDVERRSRAEDLRKEYTLQLGQLREATGLDEDEDEDAADEDDDEFIYPNSYKDDGASVFTRLVNGETSGTLSRPPISQRHSSAATLLRNSVAPSEAGTSLAAARSADLAANREFRVPTNEAPNKVTLRTGPAMREQNLQPQWERDEEARDCRGCGRHFTFFLRKHHCRRCGRIFCDACSSRRAQLRMAEIVVDPSLPGMAASEMLAPTRVCNGCHAELQLPPQLQTMRGAEAMMAVSQARGAGEASSRSGAQTQLDEAGLHSTLAAPSDVSSRASELTECPVCSTSLSALGGSEEQEAHVRNCLENGGGGSMQGGRYLVYKLPGDSPIVGKECSICMEDFVANSTIARLPCLCYFHRGCIDSWFKRGRECPVHARSW